MSINRHVLVATARIFPERSEDLAPAGCSYDVIDGAWRLESSGQFLVDAAPEARPSPPTSKKGDVETGEDMKGH
jgi:hypothetical protein